MTPAGRVGGRGATSNGSWQHPGVEGRAPKKWSLPIRRLQERKRKLGGFRFVGSLGWGLGYSFFRGLRLLFGSKLLLHFECDGVGVDLVGRGGIAQDDGGIGTSRRQQNSGLDQQTREHALIGATNEGGKELGVGSFRAVRGWKEKRADTGWRYPLHGSGLATNGLVRERFEKALHAKVVVPLQGELFVLSM